MTVGLVIAVVLVLAAAAVVFAIVMLTVALNRLVLERRRQARESLEAQKAIAAELTRLRRMLDPTDESGGPTPTISISGRVVTGRP